MNSDNEKNITEDRVEGEAIKQTQSEQIIVETNTPPVDFEPIETVHVMPRRAPQFITTKIPGDSKQAPLDSTDGVHDARISTTHTLEGDLFAAMKDNNYGNNVVKIVTNPATNTNARFIHGEQNGEMKNKDNKDSIKKYIKYTVIGVVVLVGVGVAAILYTNEKPAESGNGTATTTTATSTPIIKITSIINPEVYKKLNIANLDKNGFVREINTIKKLLRDSNIAANTNIGLTLDVDVNTFFLKLRYAGQDGLLRSFAGDYVFGLFSDKESGFEPYILLRINSYDLAFAGMLDWEPYMSGDLKSIFAQDLLFATSTLTTVRASTTNVVGSTTATSTQSQQRVAPTVAVAKSMFEEKFTDQIIKNIDTRMYVDTDTNLTLIYGFINKEYLLITGGVDSFVDIRNKILTKNILR